MPTCPASTTYDLSTVPINTYSTIDVPYTATEAGDLLLLSIVRGDSSNVEDSTPAVAGWTNISHRYGKYNFSHNVYQRVADGTETGSVSVSHGDSKFTSGVMVRLKANGGGAFDGAVVAGSTSGSTITTPSLTPSASPRLLIFLGGVPSGVNNQNYTSGTLCLLGGVDGNAYTMSNQVYAEEIATTAATDTHTLSGEGGGYIAPWRAYSGGLVEWSLPIGWHIGRIGF